MKTSACIAAACLIALAPALSAQELGTGSGLAGTSATPEFEENVAPEPEEVWTNFGCALEGVDGEPILSGTGSLAADSATAIELVGARPSAPALLVVGTTSAPTPFKGGLLLPVPASLQLLMATDRHGGIRIDFVWPEQMPGGMDIYMQYLILDPAAVQGIALSNALAAHAP